MPQSMDFVSHAILFETHTEEETMAIMKRHVQKTFNCVDVYSSFLQSDSERLFVF